MRIIHKRNYISIKKFDTIEINDFTILTGLNGAGKTHFLQAINNGHIGIDNIENNEIQYYNYNSFTIDEITKKNDPKNNANWNNGKNKILQKLAKIKQGLNNNYLQNKNNLERIIFQIIQQSDYSFEVFFNSSNGYTFFEEIPKTENSHGTLMSLHEKLQPQVFNFLDQLFMNPELSSMELEINYLKKLFKKAEENFTNYESEFCLELKKNDEDLFNYLSSNELNKDLSKLNHNDFESSDFILEEIANKEKEYQFLKLQNSFNKTLTLENGGNLSYLEPDEFIKVHGISPVEQINEILNEYNCNGYFLSCNDLNIRLGVDKNQMSVNIQLFNKEKGYQTNFTQLSSGEKTLIALSLLIHKSHKKLVPRILLLDEIDSALHPSMIIRLLSVIQKIFVDKKKLKIIMATHSVTSIALANENSIYVIDNSNEVLIKKQKKETAIELLSEGFMTLDEGISIFDQFSKKNVAIFTEGNNISFIKKAIEIISPDLLSSIDLINNLKDRTGNRQLNTLFDFFKRTTHTNKVLFVYDCDINTKYQEENNTFGFIFAENKSNKKVVKGIENLFDEKLFDEKFYSIKSKEDGGFTSNLNKPKFEKYIIEQTEKSVFENFKPLIKKIESLVE